MELDCSLGSGDANRSDAGQAQKRRERGFHGGRDHAAHMRQQIVPADDVNRGDGHGAGCRIALEGAGMHTRRPGFQESRPCRNRRQ